LEERRKVKGAAYYERKKEHLRQREEAEKKAKVSAETKKQLASYGY
jgi:large subunit ribosomal protein L13Ae